MSVSNTVMGSQVEAAYMSIADFGTLTVTLTPTTKDKVMNMDLGATNRMEAISMETQPNETVDQFIGRLRGCLKALWQGERKKRPQEDKLVEKVTEKVMEKMGGKSK